MENKYLQKTRTIWEIIRTDFRNSEDIANSIAVSPSGNYIYVAGYTNAQEDPDSTNIANNFAVVKYRTSDGLRVKKFGNSSPQDGKLITDIIINNDNRDNYANSIAISPDGKHIYVAGHTLYGNADFTVIKYNSDGIIDTNFGNSTPQDGKLRTNFGTGSTDRGYSIAISPDGNHIYVAGETDARDPEGPETTTDQRANFAVVKYTTLNGTPDETFGNSTTQDGKLITDIYIAVGAEDKAHSIALSRTHIYIAGYTARREPQSSSDQSNNFAVVKYDIYGRPDTNFGNSTTQDGKLITNFSDNSGDVAYSIAISPDGAYIYVAGYTYAPEGIGAIGSENANFAVVKYRTANGDPDDTFGNTNEDGVPTPDGKLITNFSGNSEDKANSIAISPDGNYIYVAGYTYARDPRDPTTDQSANFAVVKYRTANGDPDDTFGNTNEDGVPTPDGKLITNFSGNSEDKANSIAISPDGNYIYVAGQTNAPEVTGGTINTNFAVVKYRTLNGKLATSVKEKMMTTNGIRF